MFLTDTDLLNLTDRQTRPQQIAWLRERNYPFDVGASGRPKVLVSYLQSRLNPQQEQTIAKKSSGPRFDLLHKAR